MLQPAERAKIRLYLGFPDQFRYKHTRLESILSSISDEALDQVRGLLSDLALVDEAVFSSGIAGAGAIKQVDEIHFFGSATVTQNAQQRRTGRSYVSRLSIILGVPPYADYFGTGGYPGDSFSGGFGNPNGFYPIG